MIAYLRRFFLLLGFFLRSDIPLHDRGRIRDLAAQLDFLPLGADLLVELRKLFVDVCFFFCEGLPRNAAGVQYRFRFCILRVPGLHAGETVFIESLTPGKGFLRSQRVKELLALFLTDVQK